MKLLYLSYVQSESDLEKSLQIGDCVIVHVDTQLAFFLYLPTSRDNLFSKSKCFEICECGFQKFDNTIIFEYSSLSKMWAKKELLLKIASYFKSLIVQKYFNSILDIIEYRIDLWDTKLVVDMLNMPYKVKWDKLQLLFVASKPSISKTKEFLIQKGMPDEYHLTIKDNHQDYGKTISAVDKDGMTSLQVGAYKIKNKNGDLLVIHPSFGTRKFDSINIYGDNHIVGWNEDYYSLKSNYVLLTQYNITRSFENISKCCYSGYHVGKSNGSVYLIDCNNARELSAPKMGWDDVEEIHKNTIVVIKKGKFSIIDTKTFDLEPRQCVSMLDMVQWQRDEIYFVKEGLDWRVYNGKDKRISRRYREIRWVSKETICASDGGTTFELFNPDKDVTSCIYRGISPISFLEKNKKSITSQHKREYTTINNTIEGGKDKTSTLYVLGVKSTPMSVLIVEEPYAIRMASSLYSSVINYSLPQTISLQGLGYVYIFTPHNKKLYITTFKSKNRMEVINEIKLDSFPNDIKLSRYPYVCIESRSFVDNKQIASYILEKIRNRDSRTVNHNRLEKPHLKEKVITNEVKETINKKDDVTLKTTDVFDRRPLVIEKEKTNQSNGNNTPQKQVDISKLLRETVIKKETHSKSKIEKKKSPSKNEVIIDKNKPFPEGICYYDVGGKNILKRGSCYDKLFFGKRIKYNDVNNYYVNYVKDVFIVISKKTKDKITGQVEYELTGSGQDPRMHQTFGKNANEKVRSQRITGIRILVFYLDESEHFFFYDEVEYMSYRIEQSVKYKNDVIVFKFRSLL